MKWEWIFFDLDNTLFSYEDTFRHASQYCFSSLSKKWGFDSGIEAEQWFPVFKKYCDLHWKDYARKRLSRLEYRRKRFFDALKELHIEADTAMADEFQSLFEKKVGRFAVPFKGMSSLLEELRTANLKLGIITNGKEKVQKEKIAQLKLDGLFQESAIIISEKAGWEKPHRNIFDEASRTAGTCAKSAVYIGDSWEHDVVGASEAGWEAVYFNTRNQQPSTGHKPAAVCKSVNELRSFLLD